MNILDKIVLHKHLEVKERKDLYPTKLLEQSIFFSSSCVSLSEYVRRKDKHGIIAEIKRKSPSKGPIHPYVSIEATSIGYMQAGASAISVLTDTEFFGGKNEDLSLAREMNYSPILRKDFIIDEYQIIEARSLGADAILLIAAILEPKQLRVLAKFAHSLGLEILMEVHDLDELQASVNEYVDLIGVNNRDLKTFEVNLETGMELVHHIPAEFTRVAESGIHGPEDVIQLKAAGFHGFLIGERFMKHAVPHRACAHFIEKLKNMEAQLAATPDSPSVNSVN